MRLRLEEITCSTSVKTSIEVVARSSVRTLTLLIFKFSFLKVDVIEQAGMNEPHSLLTQDLVGYAYKKGTGKLYILDSVDGSYSPGIIRDTIWRSSGIFVTFDTNFMPAYKSQ